MGDSSVSSSSAGNAPPARPGAPRSLSIVSPVYKSAETVAELARQCAKAAAEVTDDWEVVLVDDGSPDDGWSAIVAACEADPRVRGVRLSRNFGQNQAITAGLGAATGDLVVVIDCDLQDDPADIPRLVAAVDAGHDIVFTRKVTRNHSTWRNLGGRSFHRLLNAVITDPTYRTESNVGSYSLITRPVVDAFLRLNDSQRHYLSLLRWLGFRATHVEIDHHERPMGASSYTFRRLMREAVVGITSQSERPLHLAIAAGFGFVAASMVGIVALIVLWLWVGFLAGWTSTVVLLLMCTGMVLTAVGVTGIYVGKTLDQSRGRPLFIVMDEAGRPARGGTAGVDHTAEIDHTAEAVGVTEPRGHDN